MYKLDYPTIQAFTITGNISMAECLQRKKILVNGVYKLWKVCRFKNSLSFGFLGICRVCKSQGSAEFRSNLKRVRSNMKVTTANDNGENK